MSSWVESHYPVAASRAEDDQDRETADAAQGTAPSAPAAAADEMESRARAGEPAALAEFRRLNHAFVVNLLRRAGARESHAEAVAANLWGDCVPGGDGQPGLLAKCHGAGSLRAWLARVAINRWRDEIRRESRQSAADDLADLPAPALPAAEDDLQNLLRACVRQAFMGCPAEDLLLLRLVYRHGLTQREVARMYGWHETKASRALARAMTEIRDRCLTEIHRREPHLSWSWEDLLGLCVLTDQGF